MGEAGSLFCIVVCGRFSKIPEEGNVERCLKGLKDF